jgi:capsular exopolysaccharide synthesis family protein
MEEDLKVMESYSLADELRRYALLFWQWAWLLVLSTLVFGVAAFFLSKNITPVYQAATSVLINEAPANKTTDYTSIVTSERLAQTYAQLMLKTPVLKAVIDQLGIQREPDDLEQEIQVQTTTDTQLIEIKVEDTNPMIAAAIANTLVEVFIENNQALQASRYATTKTSLETQLARLDEQIKQTSDNVSNLDPAAESTERDRLETTLAQYQQTYASLLQSYEQVRVAEAQSTSNVVQVEPAVAPEFPIRPRVLLNTVLAAFIGFALSLGGILLIDIFDDSLRNPEDITRQLGLPILGLIIRHETNDHMPISMLEPRSPVVEAFRSLRTSLQFASVDSPLRTLLITSPSPGEGKSTISTNLAIVLAQSGRSVTLFDADLRRPRIHKVFGLTNRTGLTNLFMDDEIDVSKVMQAGGVENFNVVTTGVLPPNPAELMGSEKMASIIRSAKAIADVVVIDSPPVLAVTDSVSLAPKVDGVLLIIKPGVTNMAAARQSVEQLRRVGAKILGVVLNEVDISRSKYAYYQYKGYYVAYDNYFQEGIPVTKVRKKSWVPKSMRR